MYLPIGQRLIRHVDGKVGCGTSVFEGNAAFAGRSTCLHMIAFLAASAGLQVSGLQ